MDILRFEGRSVDVKAPEPVREFTFVKPHLFIERFTGGPNIHTSLRRTQIDQFTKFVEVQVKKVLRILGNLP